MEHDSDPGRYSDEASTRQRGAALPWRGACRACCRAVPMGAGGVRLARVGRASHHGPLGQSRWPGSFYTGTSRAMSPECLALVNPLSRAGGASIGQGIPTIKSRLEMERLGDLADTHAAAQRVRAARSRGGWHGSSHAWAGRRQRRWPRPRRPRSLGRRRPPATPRRRRRRALRRCGTRARAWSSGGRTRRRRRDAGRGPAVVSPRYRCHTEVVIQNPATQFNETYKQASPVDPAERAHASRHTLNV